MAEEVENEYVSLIREMAKVKSDIERGNLSIDKFKVSFAEQIKNLPRDSFFSTMDDESVPSMKAPEVEEGAGKKESKIKRFFNKLGEALCR